MTRSLVLPADTDAALRDDAPRIGLCAGCRHLRAAASRRSLFVRCRRAAVDERYPRYPLLPVAACRGFEPVPASD